MYSVREPWYARVGRAWLNAVNRRDMRHPRLALWLFHYGER